MSNAKKTDVKVNESGMARLFDAIRLEGKELDLIRHISNRNKAFVLAEGKSGLYYNIKIKTFESMQKFLSQDQKLLGHNVVEAFVKINPKKDPNDFDI